ncbi:Os06g0476900, partial [Oryza sativa Japonica Group]
LYSSDSRNSLILFGLWELPVHLCKLITLTTIKVCSRSPLTLALRCYRNLLISFLGYLFYTVFFAFACPHVRFVVSNV